MYQNRCISGLTRAHSRRRRKADPFHTHVAWFKKYFKLGFVSGLAGKSQSPPWRCK